MKLKERLEQERLQSENELAEKIIENTNTSSTENELWKDQNLNNLDEKSDESLLNQETKTMDEENDKPTDHDDLSDETHKSDEENEQPNQMDENNNNVQNNDGMSLFFFWLEILIVCIINFYYWYKII